ncbi:hypothetical protein THAOC_32998 [Thalassiosira oceanica]|uniref:Uncharacterized protein n=1 Tax=Thalassiosira oceanica TaxID=159749 RepID=K0R829_THAOC|nr:hypothetical protein THAOC_32998 [Thalassiosira oceanica]|eukprot:EJK48224.1 hypothetical protein THAOC_32998 [Thalassiosira oceanica]
MPKSIQPKKNTSQRGHTGKTHLVCVLLWHFYPVHFQENVSAVNNKQQLNQLSTILLRPAAAEQLQQLQQCFDRPAPRPARWPLTTLTGSMRRNHQRICFAALQLRPVYHALCLLLRRDQVPARVCRDLACTNLHALARRGPPARPRRAGGPSSRKEHGQRRSSWSVAEESGAARGEAWAESAEGLGSEDGRLHWESMGKAPTELR